MKRNSAGAQWLPPNLARSPRFRGEVLGILSFPPGKGALSRKRAVADREDRIDVMLNGALDLPALAEAA